MLILLSPAKSLDFESSIVKHKSTIHFFQEETEFLVFKLKRLEASELEKLMGISPKLAQLNYQHFQNFSKEFNQSNSCLTSRQALLAFDGDVYTPINARNLNDAELLFAQNNLRILSGLYGLLRPLDLIQPYRLEMGTSFTSSTIHKEIGAKNLYYFWGNKISKHLDGTSKTLRSKHIVNLASEEYFSAIQREEISIPIIDIQFKENVRGQLKTVGINAKKARGMMTSFVIREKLSDISALREFKDGGYNFNPKISSEEKLVFTKTI